MDAITAAYTVVLGPHNRVLHAINGGTRLYTRQAKSHQSNILFLQISISISNNRPISATNTYPVVVGERGFHIDARNGSRAAGFSMAILKNGWGKLQSQLGGVIERTGIK